MSWQDIRGWYEEQDEEEGPQAGRYWYCRAHNTIFEDGGCCDLCDLDRFPADEYEECDEEGLLMRGTPTEKA